MTYTFKLARRLAVLWIKAAIEALTRQMCLLKSKAILSVKWIHFFLSVAPYCVLTMATSPSIALPPRLKFVSELVKIFAGRVEVRRAHLEVPNRRCSNLPIDERRRVRDCYDGKEFIAPSKTLVLQFVFVDIPRIEAV